MLEAMKKKVEAEGEKEKELFEKYMCYCKTSGGDLQKSIASSTAKVPEVAADIKESEAQKAQLDEDLVAHKSDREAANAAIAEATSIREKDAAAFAAQKAEYGSDIDALQGAIAAIEKGMAGSFLQTHSANVLRNVAQSSEHLMDADRQDLLAFLAAGQGEEYAPQSGQITGILKQLLDEMAKGLSEETAAEEAAIAAYDGLMAAKKKEVAALTKSIEEKSVRTGELAVSVAEMKNDLSDTEAALLEDQKFLEDLSKNCDTKQAEWDEIVKVRAEEIVALSETVKILNDDDALELFKKTLPGAASSLMQVSVSSGSLRARAISLIRAVRKSGQPGQHQLDFVLLALQGKSSGFEGVIKMIDDMVANLKKEQAEDVSKKQYCEAELDASDDKKKQLEQSVADSETVIEAAEESIAKITSEIEALQDGIKALDKMVAEATETRKSEHEEFTELLAQDSAAKDLLNYAKNRLNQFYNPKMYQPPKKRELSDDDKIVVAFGGTAAPTPAPGGIAGTGVTVLAQVSAHSQLKDAPPPPPETFSAYTKKSQETNGVMAMIDLLIKDLEKEMTTAETDEKNAQAEYEQMMTDSSEKRAADSKSLAEKEGAKADTEAALQAHKDDKASAEKELTGTLKTIAALNSECNWLLQYFSARKEARASEIDSLGKAKAVLSGSDYSLVQTRVRSLRGSA
jgi:septal ring factor EnvC (AmiA/AmiB activator)